MEGKWTVSYDGKVVGDCVVRKTGLYYNFTCCCNHVSDRICRLYSRIGGIDIDLGVLVPKDDSIVLDKTIAIKRLPVGQPEFVLSDLTKSEREEERFIPVCADAPFPWLQKLHKSRFTIRNGIPGIIITEQGCT